MEYIAQDLTELVGHAPLLEASRFCAARGFAAACSANWNP